MKSIVERAAAALLESARSGELLDDLPADLKPRNLQEAYAIQDAVIGSRPIGGWKVTVAREGAPSTCAPISSELIFGNGSVVQIKQGVAVELELAFTLRADLSAGGHYSESDIEAVLGPPQMAVEIIASRFKNRKAVGALTSLADAQNGGGIVAQAIAESKGFDLSDILFTLSINQEEIGTARTPISMAQYLTTVTWLANEVAKRGHHFRAGHVIITGARVGPVPITPGMRVDAYSPHLGELAFTFA